MILSDFQKLNNCFLQHTRVLDWMGYMRFPSSPANHTMPSSKNITVTGVSATGGNTIKDKFSILTHLPGYLSRNLYLIEKNNIIYTRGPSVPALLVILLSFLTAYLVSIRISGLIIFVEFIIAFIILFNIKKINLISFLKKNYLIFVQFFIFLLFFIYILNPILWTNPLEIIKSITGADGYRINVSAQIH